MKKKLEKAWMKVGKFILWALLAALCCCLTYHTLGNGACLGCNALSLNGKSVLSHHGLHNRDV